MRIRTRLILVLFVLVSGMMLTGCQTLEQKEIGKLQGKWVSSEDGEKVYLTISGNDFEIISTNSREFISGTLKINIEPDPKEIDLTCETSHSQESVGKTGLGLYKMEDNKLFLVTSSRMGERRPEKFKVGQLTVFTKQQNK